MGHGNKIIHSVNKKQTCLFVGVLLLLMFPCFVLFDLLMWHLCVIPIYILNNYEQLQYCLQQYVVVVVLFCFFKFIN